MTTNIFFDVIQEAVGTIINKHLPSCNIFFQEIHKHIQCEGIVYIGSLVILNTVYTPSDYSNIWSILIGSFILSYKWFIDDGYSNKSIASIFTNYTLDIINKWESYIFKKCDYSIYIDPYIMKEFVNNLPVLRSVYNEYSQICV
jgi:hypothetical protein